MLKLNLVLSVFLLPLILVAEQPAKPLPKSPVPGVTDEEWSKLPPKERMMRTVGGMIPNKTTAVGSIAIIDAQNKVSQDFLRKRAEVVEGILWMRIEYSQFDGEFVLSNLDEAVKKSKGNVAVVIVDLPGLPRVLAVPESKAALVNVAALSEGADSGKLESRVAKEISRAVAFAFGVTRTDRPGVLDEVGSLKDLDDMLVDVFTMDVTLEIQRESEHYGIQRYGRIMYKTACERGIAPPPKNKWQQRVWDEVHEIPTEPITIKP